jgi:hypothetical protein
MFAQFVNTDLEKNTIVKLFLVLRSYKE